MTTINDLLRAVCVELGFRFGFLKNSAEQSMTRQPTLWYCLYGPRCKQAQELSQEILRKTTAVKQTNPPTQEEAAWSFLHRAPFWHDSYPPEEARTSPSSSNTNCTFQKSLAHSRRGSAFPCPWFKGKNSPKHWHGPWAGTSDSARIHLTSPRHAGAQALRKGFPGSISVHGVLEWAGRPT